LRRLILGFVTPHVSISAVAAKKGILSSGVSPFLAKTRRKLFRFPSG